MSKIGLICIPMYFILYIKKYYSMKKGHGIQNNLDLPAFSWAATDGEKPWGPTCREKRRKWLLMGQPVDLSVGSVIESGSVSAIKSSLPCYCLATFHL